MSFDRPGGNNAVGTLRSIDRATLRAEFGSAGFVGAIALLAHLPGLESSLFPELGALSNDIAKRPHGTWARAPLMLVATPLITAVIGVTLVNNGGFGVLTVLTDVATSMLVMKWLRSPIAPALSAGLLPLVLDLHSWKYPPSTMIGTGLLALFSIFRQRRHSFPAAAASRHDVDDTLEQVPDGPHWLPVFFATVACLTLLAAWSGLRLLLFPPLMVIGFEMFAHPSACPWIARPWRMPLACTLSAAAGVCAVDWLGAGVLAAILAMLAGSLILRLLDLHAPPVLAVGLLPDVMRHPSYALASTVLAGTTTFFLAFAIWAEATRRPWQQ